MKKLILASQSPRRIEMMKKHGYNPVIIPADIDETLPDNILPDAAVMELAYKKAVHVARKIKENTELAKDFADAVIIAADTVVAHNNSILGKPIDRQDAYRMINGIQGKSHKVLSGVAIINASSADSNSAADELSDSTPADKIIFYDETKVNVRPMTDEEINTYLDTDEPYDKAGAYAIQGIFGKYIDSYEGSFDNVVGFPWEKIEEKLKEIL